ncbi:MAG: desulfoferrodoxin [Clostridiales Family XIII bacterium]|nr:desulfoferrodoxin [Clostridiales Family XIII bacterium]
MTFYRCNHCGNIFEVVKDAGVTPLCCGEPMEKLAANTTDAAVEKHVPVIEKDGDTVTVKVGSVPHPMLEEHYIQWVVIAQNGLIQRAALKPGGAPEATFKIADADAPVTAYEYCNLHGLWAAEA